MTRTGSLGGCVYPCRHRHRRTRKNKPTSAIIRITRLSSLDGVPRSTGHGRHEVLLRDVFAQVGLVHEPHHVRILVKLMDGRDALRYDHHTQKHPEPR
eukprot:6030363-Pyramimonas_sp.AAC.1